MQQSRLTPSCPLPEPSHNCVHLPWLRLPFAHRGLHDESAGVIENTASAFAAAAAAGYGIEADLQAARCGEPVVFHDSTLERLTNMQGRVSDFTASQLRGIALRDTSDRILTLKELLNLVGTRVPLLLEIKSDGADMAAFAGRIAKHLESYNGLAAVMSFDPFALTPFLRLIPTLPRGLVAMRFRYSDWPSLPAVERFRRTHLLPCRIVRPAFIAYDIRALPTLATRLARAAGLPLLAWTVRTSKELNRAARHADGIIFENIRPSLLA